MNASTFPGFLDYSKGIIKIIGLLPLNSVISLTQVEDYRRSFFVYVLYSSQFISLTCRSFETHVSKQT